MLYPHHYITITLQLSANSYQPYQQQMGHSTSVDEPIQPVDGEGATKDLEYRQEAPIHLFVDALFQR